jgi:hypothetical protein
MYIYISTPIAHHHRILKVFWWVGMHIWT